MQFPVCGLKFRGSRVGVACVILARAASRVNVLWLVFSLPVLNNTPIQWKVFR